MVREKTPRAEFRFALGDSIAFLNPEDWDRVVASSGVFFSRPFLDLLERHRPENLSIHYALAYSEGRSVAAVVAQSLEIRVADLSPGHVPEQGGDFWHSVGAAAERSISRARTRILLYDDLLLWPHQGLHELAKEEGELWSEVATQVWRRGRRWWHSFRSPTCTSASWCAGTF
jgi:hypothetical protein